MNTKRLTDKLFDKWPAKIICFIIAVFLYFFHQASLVETKTFVLPLEVIENGMVMHLGNIPKSVSVVVRADDNDIKSILPSDMTATVSLDSITEKGTYNLPVNILLSEHLMEMDPLEVKLKDEIITVQVDTKSFKYVPILPSIIGEVSHGYEIQNISMTPSTVEIFGPSSIVNATQEIYSTRLNVSNAETNFATEVSYQNLDNLLTVVDEGPFKATVSVVPKIMERDFTEVEIEVVNLSSALEIKDGLPLISLKLSGSMPLLENYNLSKHAVQLNCKDIIEPGSYEIPLRYVIPANLQLMEKSDEELTVNVIKKTEPENASAEGAE